MHRSDNTLRYLAALAASVGLLALLGALVAGYLIAANARLRKDNQQLHVLIQKPVFVPVAPPVSVSPIRVNVSGGYNNVYFDYADFGGAAGDVNVEGYNGTTTVHLGAGQTAQVTVGGYSNAIHIAPSVNERVSCTSTGNNCSVGEWK